MTGTGLLRLIGMLASFAVGVQLARILGVTDYGYYGIALAIVSVAGIPGEMGLPRLVTREIAAAQARDDLPALFGIIRWADRMAVRISLGMAVAVVVGSLVIPHKGGHVLSLALLLGAPLVPLVALTRIRGGALLALDQIASGQAPDIVFRPLILSFLIFVVAQLTRGVSAPTAMLLNSIAAGGAFISAHFWVRAKLGHLKATHVTERGRRWLASSIPMALTDGMRILQSELSSLVLGALSAPAQVALFRIANVTATTAAMPIAVVNQVAFPVLARLYAEGDRVRLQKTVTRLAQVQFAGVLMLCLPLVIWPKFLLMLVFGSGYAPAGTALRILACAQIISAALGPSAVLLNMTEHERRVTRATMIALPLNLVGVLVLAPEWRSLGAATAFSAALLGWNMLAWVDARRLLGIDTSIFNLMGRHRLGSRG